MKYRAVAFNALIDSRGYSGSSTALGALVRAAMSLVGSERVRLLRPDEQQRTTRIGRLSELLEFDLRTVQRQCRPGELLVAPTNIGRATRANPCLTVMHDLMVLRHPEQFDRGYVAYARAAFPLSVKLSTALVAPSEFSASCIRDRWPEAKVSVLRWPAPAAEPSQGCGPRSERRTFVMLGVTEPHKRHQLGIEAVRLARLLTGEDYRLVVIGRPGRAEAEVANALQRCDPEGVWTSRRANCTTAEVRQILDTAVALIQPSLEEGFGLPVIEAGGQGVPSVTSGLGALSEFPSLIAEDPHDVLSYARALLEVVGHRGDEVIAAMDRYRSMHDERAFGHAFAAVLEGV